MSLRLRQRRCVLTVLLMMTLLTTIQASPIVVADSTGFVTASILVVSPGRESYSTVGHCALRMECPSHNLDYCFTYETDINEDLYLRFLTGKTQGGLFVVPSTRYLADHSKEGRGITAYALNLTYEQKQELWRSLDEELPLQLHKPFDFFRRNCTSMIYEKILSVMTGEYVVGKEYRLGRRDNRQFFKKAETDAPWTFFLGSLFANYVRPDVHIVERQYPVSLPDWLQQAEIVTADGSVRPLLQSSPKQLVRERIDASPPAVTPTVTFVLLLVWVLAVTICQMLGVATTFVHISDGILFFAYIFVALLLLDATVVNLFGERWNWMLVPFNLLPLLLWLTTRHRPWYRYVWLVYCVVLFAFMVFLPFYRGVFEWPLMLLFVSLLIRCFCQFIFKPCERSVLSSR